MAILSWHRPLWDSQFATGRIPASLLLSGARGSGVKEFGLGVAAALLCATPTDKGEACGTCDDCRWTSAGRHPDLLLLGEVAMPDSDSEDESPKDEEDADKPKEKEKHLIPVTAIRSVISFFQVTPNRDRARVVVMAPAEWMNPAAANSLLKVLEEPPPRAHLILVSHTPARLPATVRSRCVSVRLPKPTMAEAQRWLEDQGVRTPALVLQQLGGAPLAHGELRETYWDARSRLLPLVSESAPKRRSADLLGLADSIELADAHRLMHTWCADLIACSAGLPARYHPDFQSSLDRLGPVIPRKRLLSYESRLRASRRWLDHPMNPKLAVEDLLLGYLAIFEEA